MEGSGGMSEPFYPEPQPVAQEVDHYLYGEFSDAEKHSNRDLLDESGIWSLHRLAAHIYAMGFRDGHMVGGDNERKARQHQSSRSADSPTP
jgi:hypothetical protein